MASRHIGSSCATGARPSRPEAYRNQAAWRGAKLGQLSLLLPGDDDTSPKGKHQCYRVSSNQDRSINVSFLFLMLMLMLHRMAAACCCLFGGICCAFLPFCMEMCHDAHHFCAQCGQKVAIRPHDGPVQVFSPAPPVVIAPGHIQPPQAVAVSHGTSGISEKN